jgi:hypothetical protein
MKLVSFQASQLPSLLAILLAPETYWVAPGDQKLIPAKDYEETPDND